MTSPVHISETQADYQDTERSTAQTVKEMCSHIRVAIQDPEVRRVANQIVRGSPTPMWLASAVWDWCKRNVTFEQDEDQLLRLLGRRDELELLISPSVLLRARQKSGDCDDFTMLACALLACLGVPPLIKTFKCSREEPGRWSHVCAAAVLEDGSAFPVDASHGEYPGWEVPANDVYESALWDMNGNRVGGQVRRSRGLGGYVAEPEWTGNEMSTVSGAVAGPYPGGDFTRAYYPGPSRLQTLRGIAGGKFGMGAVIGQDCSSGECEAIYGDNSPGPSYIDSVTGDLVGGNGQILIPGNRPNQSSGGGNFWENLVSQLTGSGVRLASQAIGSGATVLPNGNVLLPSGQIVSGTPQQSGGISTNMLIIGGLVIGGVVLVSMMKK